MKLLKFKNITILIAVIFVVSIVLFLYLQQKESYDNNDDRYGKCVEQCTNVTYTTSNGEQEQVFSDKQCNIDCEKEKPFDYKEATKNDCSESNDLSHKHCIAVCLDSRSPTVCGRDCDDWAREQGENIDKCTFRPGGLTPGDCKKRCEDYYDLLGVSDICDKNCQAKCNECSDVQQCKWLSFKTNNEFPYQLSIFGVAGNTTADISWEKPPFPISKYIIVYFQENRQHESGVNIEEIDRPSIQCGNDPKYCNYTLRGLENNENYVIGVSMILQNNNVTRMSNRLVLQPMVTQSNIDTKQVPQNNKSNSCSPSQLLEQQLKNNKIRANTQKIVTEFQETNEANITDLFQYLVSKPLNLQFKLS